MADKTQKQMTQELYQAVVGIPENEDENGLIGDVQDLTKLVREQNKRVGKVEGKVNKMWGILIGIGVVGGTGLGFGINNLFGG